MSSHPNTRQNRAHRQAVTKCALFNEQELNPIGRYTIVNVCIANARVTGYLNKYYWI